jgi:hypothetical protein
MNQKYREELKGSRNKNDTTQHQHTHTEKGGKGTKPDEKRASPA